MDPHSLGLILKTCLTFSGKKSERQEISDETVYRNLQGIKSDIVKIFTNHQTYMWEKGQNKGKV